MSQYDPQVKQIEDIRDAHSFMIHSAVTLIHKKARIIAPGQTHKQDREIIQLGAEFPRSQFPITEAQFLRAFSEMAMRCLDRARQCGLIKQ